MRIAFEQWALRSGHSIRRREDRPEQYLLAETERRWQIWQTALTHGRPAAGRAASDGAGAQAAALTVADAAAMREEVLNDVLDVCSRMGHSVDIGTLMVIVSALRRPGAR